MDKITKHTPKDKKSEFESTLYGQKKNQSDFN